MKLSTHFLLLYSVRILTPENHWKYGRQFSSILNVPANRQVLYRRMSKLCNYYVPLVSLKAFQTYSNVASLTLTRNFTFLTSQKTGDPPNSQRSGNMCNGSCVTCSNGFAKYGQLENSIPLPKTFKYSVIIIIMRSFLSFASSFTAETKTCGISKLKLNKSVGFDEKCKF